jgi:signal transduction histidine kinase
MTLVPVIWSMIASACLTLAAVYVLGRFRKYVIPVKDFGKTILASLPNHVAILDRNGMIVGVNKAWEDFARANGGMSSMVGVGCSYLDVCRGGAAAGESTAQRAFDGVRSVLDGFSEFFEMDYPCHSPEESRWFLMRVMPLKAPEGGAVISHDDISRLRRAEQEAESLLRGLEHSGRVALLGEISGSLAHELNQPLEAILANAQAARRWLASPQPDLDEIRHIIEDIIRDDSRAGEIVHSVRALVKKEVPSHQLMDVNRMVRETASLLSRELLLADVPLVLELHPELPLVAAGSVELQQALLNLMLNGLQAQDAVQRSCRGMAVFTRNAGDRVVISVRDHGPGLSSDIAEHMFDAFFTTKSGGLGLGLALCRQIAKTHGGELSAQNHPEGGAVFSLLLPVKERRS